MTISQPNQLNHNLKRYGQGQDATPAAAKTQSVLLPQKTIGTTCSPQDALGYPSPNCKNQRRPSAIRPTCSTLAIATNTFDACCSCGVLSQKIPFGKVKALSATNFNGIAASRLDCYLHELCFSLYSAWELSISTSGKPIPPCISKQKPNLDE